MIVVFKINFGTQPSKIVSLVMIVIVSFAIISQDFVKHAMMDIIGMNQKVHVNFVVKSIVPLV